MTSRLAFNSMSGSCSQFRRAVGFSSSIRKSGPRPKVRKNESSRRASLGKRPAADVHSALNNGRGIGATERSHGVMSTAYSPDR
jgi:hypothetical protein